MEVIDAKPEVGADSQLITFPKEPDNTIVADDPLQMAGVVVEVVPPLTTFTVAVTTFENVVAHKAPFEITAR